MKVLNLVYPDKSDIKFDVSHFPDGQQQVTILGEHYYRDATRSDAEQDEIIPLKSDSRIVIKARMNSFSDLEIIICATKSLRNMQIKEIHLYVPYFLGCRSDRKFTEGSDNYLKDVICPIINMLGFETVTVIDPHSDVLEACLNNFKKFDNSALVHFAFEKMYLQTNQKSNAILVSPDAGASKKIYKIAEKIGYKGDVIVCSKDRDELGKLTKTIIPDIKFNDWNQDIVIIDDICDGGRTFLNIVKAIKEKYKVTGKFYLIVTHGIFSAGFYELAATFDGIYCTNSYSDVAKTVGSDKVKQLNVF